MLQAYNSVIAFKDYKEAALLFDRVVIPHIDGIRGGNVTYSFHVATERRTKNPGDLVLLSDFPSAFSTANPTEVMPLSVLFELTYGDPSPDKLIAMYDHYADLVLAYKEYGELWSNQMRKHMRKVSPKDWYKGPVRRSIPQLYVRDENIPGGRSIRNLVADLADRVGLHKPSLILPDSPGLSSDTGDEDVLVTLIGISRINTELLAWEDVMEIRKDKDAIAKLRRFRQWARQSFNGKSRNEIADDLAIAIDDFHAACKELGVKTSTGTWSEVLDKSNIASLGGLGAALAIAWGMPIDQLPDEMAKLATGATRLAAVFSLLPLIGKIGLAVRSRRLDAESLHRTHPVVYLVDLEKRSQ